MSHSALDEVQCPICIDTLKKPIRMLSCGHNFCHDCLVDLRRGKQQINCPICRKVIDLGSNGIEGIARCRMLENVIEKLGDGVNKMQIYQPISPQPQVELNSLAESLMKQQKYQNAAEIQTILINKKQTINKVPLMVKKAKCLLEVGEIEEAKQVCVEMISIIDSTEGATDMKGICDGCDEEIENIAQKFLEKKECDVGIGLANCMFKLIKYLTKGNNKLNKLENVGLLMEDIVDKMSKQNRGAEFKPQLEKMNEILTEMQSISDVDIKTKYLKVTLFLKYFGFCCDEVKDYSRSIQIHNQAISGMMLMYGEDACKYRVFGLCCNNLGLSYEKINQLVDAKASFTKAIDVYSSATDHPSDELKSDSIMRSSRNLDRINQKLHNKRLN